MKCANCGKAISKGSLFCNKCGAKVEIEDKKTSKSSAMTNIVPKDEEKTVESKTNVQEDSFVEPVVATINEPANAEIIKQARPKPSFLTVERYLTPSLILGALFVLMICSLFAGAKTNVRGITITQLNLFHILGNLDLLSNGGAILATSHISSLIALIACVITSIVTFLIALVKLIKAFKTKQNINLFNYLLTALSIFVFASTVCYLGNSYQRMPNTLNGASIAGLVISAVVIAGVSVFRIIANKEAGIEFKSINIKSIVFNAISIAILFALQIMLASPLYVANGVFSTVFGMLLLGQSGGWIGGTIEALLPYLLVCTAMLFVILSLKRKICIVLQGGTDKSDKYAPWIILFSFGTTVFTIVTVALMSGTATGMEGIAGYLVFILSIVYGYISKAGRYAVINANKDNSEKLTGFNLVESYLTNGMLMLVNILMVACLILSCINSATRLSEWNYIMMLKGQISDIVVIAGAYLSCVIIICILVCANKLVKGMQVNLLKLAKFSFAIFLISELFSILSIVSKPSAFQPNALKIITFILSVLIFATTGILYQKKKGALRKQKSSVLMVVMSLISFCATFAIVSIIMLDIAPAPLLSMEELFIIFSKMENMDIIATVFEMLLILACVFSALWCINNIMRESKKSKFVLPIITLILITIYSVMALVMIISIGDFSPVRPIILLVVSVVWFACAFIANKARKKALLKNSEEKLEQDASLLQTEVDELKQ